MFVILLLLTFFLDDPVVLAGRGGYWIVPAGRGGCYHKVPADTDGEEVAKLRCPYDNQARCHQPTRCTSLSMYDENNYDLMYCDDNAIYTVSVVSSIFNCKTQSKKLGITTV